MKFSRRTLDATIPYAASSTTQLDIPRDRFIQKLELLLTLTGNTSSGTLTPNADGAAAIINNLRLVANGNQVVAYITPRDLVELNKLDTHQQPANSLLTTTGQTGVQIGLAQFRLDFMNDPLNDYDAVALLPAHDLSSLTLYIDWATPLAIGANLDYQSVTGLLNISLRECDMTAQDIASVGKFLRKKWSYRQDVQVAGTGYVNAIDLPVGSVLKRQLLRVVNNSVLSDAILINYMIEQQSPIKQQIIQNSFLASKQADQFEYYIAPATGYTMMDYSELGFLDLRRLKQGDVKFKYNSGTVAGTTYIRTIHEEYY